MKQINFREINSKNYVKGTLKGGSQPKTATTQIKKSVNKSARHNASNNSTYKRRHQTYQEAFDELNAYINKVRVFTYGYINQKKKEKGFFGRILSKLLRID